ncbi:MAG: class I SAM-dependent methyltransferase [Bdellovibrionota bacterium]
MLGLLWMLASPGLPARADETRPGGVNAYQKVTGDDAEDDRKHWDSIYKTGKYVFGREPADFVRDQIGLLHGGRALDIAMGEGRNAVFLAKKGFNVDGVDLSEVALKKARQLARQNRTFVNTINADLTTYSIKPESYDVILNIDYLQRSLIPQIKRGLKHGGIVIFENETVEQVKNVPDQKLVREYLLEKGELRTAFKEFEILVYRETNDGKEAKASLVARKP